MQERRTFGPSLTATPTLSDRSSQQPCTWHWPKPSRHPCILSEIFTHAIQAKSSAVSTSPEHWQGYHYSVPAVKQTQSSTIAPRREDGSAERTGEGLHLLRCAKWNSAQHMTKHELAMPAASHPAGNKEKFLLISPLPPIGEYGKGKALQMKSEKLYKWKKKPNISQDAKQLFIQDSGYKYSF